MRQADRGDEGSLFLTISSIMSGAMREAVEWSHPITSSDVPELYRVHNKQCKYPVPTPHTRIAKAVALCWACKVFSILPCLLKGVGTRISLYGALL